jgi:LPXTG-motif cell wall-anchored protein
MPRGLAFGAILGLLGAILGGFLGANFGGNFAPDFEFAGTRGYEATGPIGTLLGAALFAGCGSLLARRRPRG